jgi:hypothetical protein
VCIYINILWPSLYVLLQVELQIHQVILGHAVIPPKKFQFTIKFNLILIYIDNVYFIKPLAIFNSMCINYLLV